MTKILGIICIAGSIVLAVAMFKQQSNDSNGSASNRGNQLTRHSAPVVLLGIGLRLLLSGGSAGSISLSLPKRSGTRDISAGLPGHPALRSGQNPFASNPARLDLNFAHWLAANPRHIVFNAIVAGGAVILLLIKWQVGLALLIVTGIVLYRTRKDMRGKFHRGDVCPGVVLSAETGSVAVLADLKAATNVARPAIKILKQPLHKMSVYALQDGMRVATVAEYYGDVRQTSWKNFFPEVIPCSVRDEAENQRILESIPEEQWQALDNFLAQIPEARPGLYRLWGGNLAADMNATVPWLQRKSVRIGLVVFAVFGGLIIFMQATVRWNERSREQRAQTTSGQATSLGAPVNHRPAMSERMDLGGKIVTVTNVAGFVLKDIELVEVSPMLLTYRNNGQEQKIPLIALPREFLDSLDIPKTWPGYPAANPNYRPETVSGSQFTRPPGMARAAPSAYQPGQRILANWAGKRISGTVIENFSPYSCRVQLEDPRFRTPIVLSTNLLRPQ